MHVMSQSDFMQLLTDAWSGRREKAADAASATGLVYEQQCWMVLETNTIESLSNQGAVQSP
jgi:hypothetical protein